MSHLAVNGLVVRAVEYKEADLILSVITEQEGTLTVTARGARRRGSPHAAASQVLCYSRMVLSEYRDRFTLKEAEILEGFSAMRGSLLSMALASYLIELAQTLAPEGELFRLTLIALANLNADRRPHKLIKAAFEMRALFCAGFGPETDACSRCGDEAPTMLLPALGGRALCPFCARQRGEDIDAMLPYDTDCRLALRHIRTAPAEKVFSFTASDKALAKLAALCEFLTLAQTDRVPAALDFYRGLL
ncbi:MAG: DNA repair protein RecO [Oscillospiraceae bacterium]|jgi:DNA repair protein RecO (recombination protein O)|nr:DNA repair protein RecO [Oscillospiraceae bacterium]